MAILVVFNSFNEVKNLKKPDLVAHQKPPFYTTARFVNFTVPSGRRGALFFLRGQMYTSGSTFIKKIKPFVYHYISMPGY